MDPEEAFCLNPDCPARGQRGKGNIRGHSRKEQRYLCTVCGRTFSARKGTVCCLCHVVSDPPISLATTQEAGPALQSVTEVD